jgi:hypothetical protein
MSSSSSENKAFDPSRRRLCPDGACIGLLDESGRCKECGLVAGRGTAPTSAQVLPTSPSPSRDEWPDDAEPDETAPAPAEGEAAFDPTRRLCSDGSCVGVIGPDGRCRVCGAAAEG